MSDTTQRQNTDMCLIPNTVGHYVVCFLIGEGSYSQVYLGREQKTNDPVALKFVSRDMLKDKMMLRHFEKELRVFERIHHPGIAQYYETI